MERNRFDNSLLRDRILSAQANPNEVMEWYFRNDPLREVSGFHRLLGEKGDDRAIYKEMSELILDTECLALGGAELALSVIHPEFFSEPQDDSHCSWYDKVDAYFSEKYKEHIVAPDNRMSIGEITYTAGRELIPWLISKDGKLTVEQSDTLMCAANMMHAAVLGRVNFQKIKLEMASDEYTPVNELECSMDTSLIIYDIIARQASSPDSHTEVLINACKAFVASAQIAHIEMKGLKTASKLVNTECSYEVYLAIQRILFGSSGVNVLVNPENDLGQEADKVRNRLIKNFAYFIHKIYIGENKDGLLYRKKPGKDVKGSLYEALWILDFNVLQTIDSNTDLTVIPSFSAEDAPRVNYPRLRRGFDVTVYGEDVFERIQLKSSVHAMSRGNKYHPFILLAYDDFVRGVDPDEISAKLEEYQEFFSEDNGLDVESKKVIENHILTDLILKSVIDVSERLKDPLNKTRYGLLGKIAARYLGQHSEAEMFHRPNREQRRAAAKKARKNATR